MADSERFELEQLIRECRRALTTSAVREGERLDSDMDTLLHRVRQRRAVRDYTTEVLEAQASRDAVMEAEQERIDRLVETYGIAAGDATGEPAGAAGVGPGASEASVDTTVGTAAAVDPAGASAGDTVVDRDHVAATDGLEVAEKQIDPAPAQEPAAQIDEDAAVAEAIAATAAAVVADTALREDAIDATTTAILAVDAVAEAREKRPANDALTDLVIEELAAAEDDAKHAPQAAAAITPELDAAKWAAPEAAPGRVIFVVGKHRFAQELIATAQRLAQRITGPVEIILGGPKTLLPGNEERVKSARELVDAIVDHGDATVILVLAASHVAAHQKTMTAFLQAVEPVATWAVVDVADPQADVAEQIADLPDGLAADVLVPFNCWDTRAEEWLTQTDLPVGMLDGAPASAALWQVIHSYHAAL